MSKLIGVASLILTLLTVGCKASDESGLLETTGGTGGQHFLLDLRPTNINSLMTPSPNVPAPPTATGAVETGYMAMLQMDAIKAEARDLFISTQGGVLYSHDGTSKERLFIIVSPGTANHGKLFTGTRVIGPSDKSELNLLLNIARLVIVNNLFSISPDRDKIELFFNTYFQTSILSNTYAGTNNGISAYQPNPQSLQNPNGLQPPYPATPGAQTYPQPTLPGNTQIDSQNPFAFGGTNQNANPQQLNNGSLLPGATIQPFSVPGASQAGPQNFPGTPGIATTPNLSGNPTPPAGQVIAGTALATFIRFPAQFQLTASMQYQHPQFGNVQTSAMIDQFKNGLNATLIGSLSNPGTVPPPQGDNSLSNPPNPNPGQSSGSMDLSTVVSVNSESDHDATLAKASGSGVRKALVMVGNPTGCPPCKALHEEVQTNLAGKDGTLYMDIDYQQTVQTSDKLSQIYTGVSAYPHVFIVDPSTGRVLNSFQGRDKTAADLTAELQRN